MDGSYTMHLILKKYFNSLLIPLFWLMQKEVCQMYLYTLICCFMQEKYLFRKTF